MGNHDAGRAIVALATLAAERRLPDETALQILDIALDRADARGADAEFDDETQPDTAFGKLLTEAFAPDGKTADDYDAEDDDDGETWYNEVYRPFRERYGLC